MLYVQYNISVTLSGFEYLIKYDAASAFPDFYIQWSTIIF
jgi:hypothetical protein